MPVALIPAAGSASRLPGISGSKEMLKVAAGPGDECRPVLQHLLTNLSESGLRRIVLVTSPGKRDILDYLGRPGAEPKDVTVELIANSSSMPHTLSNAARRYRQDNILMALPDILFRPRRALADLLNAWPACKSDVLLSVFPTDRPEKSDIVETDRDGGVVGIRIKENSAPGGHAWIMALWRSAFTHFLTEWLNGRQPGGCEPQLGEVFNDAIPAGLHIHTVKFPAGEFLDIGTPEDLQRLQRRGFSPSDDQPTAD